MEWTRFLLPVLVLALLSLAILKFKALRFNDFPKWTPLLVFFLKVAAGLILYLIYSHYYGDRSSSDIFRYYDDAVLIRDHGRHDWRDYLAMISGIGDGNEEISSIYNSMNNWYRSDDAFIDGNARFLIRFHALVLLISGGNYHVHYILSAFIGFLGGLFLWKGFYRLDPRHSLPSLFIIFLIPSTLLWTSAVLKESFLFLALGLLFYSLIRFIKGSFGWKATVAMIISLLLFTLLRPWMGIASLLIAGFVLITGRLGIRWQLMIAGITLLSVIALDTANLIGISDILISKQEQFRSLSAVNGTAGQLALPDFLGTPVPLLTSIPLALFNALLQPNPLSASSAFEWVCAIEQLFLLLTILFLLMRFITPESPAAWLFLLFFSVTALMIIGATVPYTGAIVRYRSIMMPLLMLAILHSSAFACPLMKRLRIGS